MDYRQVLEAGTPTVVGTGDSRPPDLREAVEAAFTDGAPNWQAADAVLDQAWVQDARLWRRRLALFLEGLSSLARSAFADLVEAGCQPDMLAFQFHEATRVTEYTRDHRRLRADLDQLDKLGRHALDALTKFANRRQQFDDYLLSRRSRAVEGEPGDAELRMLVVDLKDLVARHTEDNAHMRRQLDGRRQPLLGHAEVRLSRQVYEATGAYYDRKVERILDDIRHRMGHKGRVGGALKKRRQRRSAHLVDRARRGQEMRDE